MTENRKTSAAADTEYLDIKNKEDFSAVTAKIEPIKDINGFMWFFVKRHIKPFVFVEFMAIMIALLSVLRPWIVERLMNVVEKEAAKGKVLNDEFMFYVLAFPAIWLLKSSFRRLHDWVQVRVKPLFEADVRISSFAYVCNHSLEYFTNHFAGSLSTKVQDLGRSGRRVFDFAPRFTRIFMTFVFSLLIFLKIHAFFGVITCIWIVVHLSWCFYASKKWNELSRIASEARSTAIGKQVDSLSNYMNVKFFSRRRSEYSYLKKYVVDEVKKRQANNINIQKHLLALSFFCFIFMGVFFISFQVSFYARGIISLAEFVYLFVAITPVIEAVFEMGFELVDFSLEYGTLKQAFSIIKVPFQVRDAENAKPLLVSNGVIEYKNVSFKYSDGGNMVFDNLNLRIEKGQKVGIVGRSGVGKTSFINLLLRFYDVTSGAILIDGQNVAEVTGDSLRSNIALIPQDTTLFHRTLRENIRFGRLDATDDEVIDAAKKSFADAFITKIPLGYDCLVGERGIKLSSGQRQRVAIARAILKNAPILILDEATSALDSETEVFIQQSLQTLMRDKTVLAIAHRLSTLREMDRILVFSDGRIVEDGTHEDLVKLGGLYADLWRMQSGGFLGGIVKKDGDS